MSQLKPFYAKDVGVKLTLTLLNAAGAAFDLTGFTAEMNLAGLDPLTMVIDDATAGVASYTVSAPDTFPAGVYNAQIKVTNGASTFRSSTFLLTALASPLTP